MSWFEKAKTALIEALDIQEDERGIESIEQQATTQTQPQQLQEQQSPKVAAAATASNAGVNPGAATAKQHDTQDTITKTISTTTASIANVNPSAIAKALPGSTISAWGSFTGSFFENPKANEMITTAPTSSAASRSPTTTTTSPPDPKLKAKRKSSTSNSDSIELLTNTATSPTDAIIQQIPSDEVTTTATPSSEIADNDTNACAALPDSIVIIDTQSKSSNDDCSPDEQMPEQRMLDSDSTQSFEELQMATSILTLGSEDKTDFEKITTPSYSSPPHSNDEIETTTSSDIEIISNPNGDSSSTHSATRASPLKLKKFAKTQPTAVPGAGVLQTRASSSSVNPTTVTSGQKRGHCREASEISILSEDSQTELDKLVQRISELNEILEARELRLLQSERQNAMLQERNHSLQQTVDNLKSNTQQHDSTQQLSALEKKFQTSLQECDALRIQIKTLKQELQLKIPKKELDDSKAMVSELQLEGEKLSKEILHQSNIIKKLRAKEKTTEATLKKNAEQLAQLSDEVERLKKTLSAKEEVERTQIETIHKMSSDKRKLNDELAQQRSKVEDLQSKLGTVQTSFEAVKTELQQRTRQHTDLTRTAEEVAAAKKAKELAAAENEEMLQQLSELREKLRSSEQHSAKREQQLREENRELLRRLEAAELRAESTTEDVSLATIPLLRQIESLQKTLNQRTSNWNREEKQLLEKLHTSESRLKSLESVESTFQEQIDILRNRCIELEDQLSSALMQAESAKIAQRQAELDISLKESNLNRQIKQLTSELEKQQSKFEALQERNHQLETKVLTKTASTETTMASVLTEANVGEITRLAEQQQQALMQQQHSLQRPSPPHSYGVNSLEDAIGGNVDWQADDMDCVSQAGGGAAGGATSSFGHGLNISFMSNNTSTLEHLQSLLKQRDGEVSHLQWELSRLQAERNVYNDEITNLTVELENLKDKLPAYEAMERSFADLQTRYEALLEMYGEKVERMQELELDLIEARQAYKVQIDELLSQRNSQT